MGDDLQWLDTPGPLDDASQTPPHCSVEAVLDDVRAAPDLATRSVGLRR